MSASATAERRQQDIGKLEALCQQSQGRIRILSRNGSPVREVVVEMRYRTAPSSEYPSRVQESTQVRIELSDRYPFQEPTASVVTPILHPNVFTSGRICLGKKWMPTENLALFVRRVALIVTFDPTVLSEASPANAQALQWYRTARSRHPAAFPTDQVILFDPEAKTSKKIEWKEQTPSSTAPPSRVEVQCPACRTRLRVPAGRRGHVKCTSCSATFEAKS